MLKYSKSLDAIELDIIKASEAKNDEETSISEYSNCNIKESSMDLNIEPEYDTVPSISECSGFKEGMEIGNTSIENSVAEELEKLNNAAALLGDEWKEIENLNYAFRPENVVLRRSSHSFSRFWPPTRRRSRLVDRQKECFMLPLRVCRAICLMTIVPFIFIIVPVYLRSNVLIPQTYPIAMTDMRLIDRNMYTTWCQRQIIQLNTSFNAYVVPKEPDIISDNLVPVTMTRHLELEDDMKEYWGFYLLQGSLITVSTCVRYPGASLIMIRGHKHLQQCAYIGDDSSEELEELLEANALGILNNETFANKVKLLLQDSPANQPENMNRYHKGVKFHDPSRQRPIDSDDVLQNSEIIGAQEVTDPKELNDILQMLNAHRKKLNEKKRTKKPFRKPEHLATIPELINRFRETNVDRNEEQWLTFQDLHDKHDIDLDSIVMNITNSTGKIQSKTIMNINKTKEIQPDHNYAQALINNYNKMDNQSNTSKRENSINRVPYENNDENIKQVNPVTSAEVLEDIFQQLKKLGDGGTSVLEKLNEKMQSLKVASYEKANKNSSEELDLELIDAKVEHLKQILNEAIEETRKIKQSRASRKSAAVDARYKRELYLRQASLREYLNEDDSDGDAALEEGLVPDGVAEDHKIINETTPYDMSNSEFWSSFSSSEEALLECDGLILNLPLTPHTACYKNNKDEEHYKASLANAITYKVPVNGYYFFVFNSENEVQKNFVRAKFDLQKTKYNLTNQVLEECKNVTDSCKLPLNFFTNEKVVLEFPLRNNDSLWNEQLIVTTECEPRVAMFIFCSVAVLASILCLSFQKVR